MFKIHDGREHFYQWDTNRKLIVNDDTITEVHFCNKTRDFSLVNKVYIENGIRVVDIPNELLNSSFCITAYANDGEYTKYSAKFDVMAKTKPDYLYEDNNPLKYANNISSVFAYTNFPDDYTVELDIPNVNSLQSAFCGSNISKIILKGYNDSAKDFNHTFSSCVNLKTVDMSMYGLKILRANYAFSNCINLKEIIGIIDLTQCLAADDVFYGCTALEEIRFLKDSINYLLILTPCMSLSVDSIQSIIEGLNDKFPGVLMLHDNVTSKLTNEQLLKIFNKKWSVE